MKFNMVSLEFLRTTALLTTLLSTVVKGNTPLTEEFVDADLQGNQGFGIAFASRPMWHFGISAGNLPCYAAPAFDQNGNQHGVEPSPWPHASWGCPDPGPRGKSNPFPTYYTITRCNPSEIRVAYNLYFPKDGFSNVIIAKGHVHDWERVVAIWRKSPQDNLWYRSTLLKSFHSGYMLDDWPSIQNTIDYSNPQEQGAKNKDGPKIYVGWAKHAMFSTRNTGWNDPGSQGCKREFRSSDYWFIPEDKETLVYAGESSELGKQLISHSWGSATSNPVVVERKICGEGEGGYTACGFEADEEQEGVDEHGQDL